MWSKYLSTARDWTWFQELGRHEMVLKLDKSDWLQFTVQTSGMPSHIKLWKSAEEVDVHSVPCRIHADDHANVSTYFLPKRNESLEGVESASFRGYPLDGAKMCLPKGYKGLVLNSDSTSGTVKNLKCSGTFGSMTYWNWNKIPSKNDPLLAAMDWIDISAVIHEPSS
ncbi:Ribonuclease H2 non-catalytic subunit (Ylr154p-like) [Nesidiocoris tenuis]|uniref:Ribonuclease H2 non-catalytic subunit (Ylr154p-like) n=1 Tax=Nesidiocoris tenuis TaxID=355587 RepID=A0ABN7ABG2_9HEMI|nr:Ribonuclease H2 non-catalytic subunit (Ylr154p-like) [Nesidiocoris tenuis]